MALKARGASQLRSLSAVRGLRSTERHVHQFQIASLELEMSRRSQERRDAIDKITTIDHRLGEIQALIRSHQAALGATSPGNPPSPPSPPSLANPPAATKKRTLTY